MRRLPTETGSKVASGLRRFRAGIASIVFAALAACGGSDGSTGPAGPPGPGSLTRIDQAAELSAAITSVSIASAPLVQFTLRDERRVPVTGLPASAIGFSLARLTPGANGNASAWQSYINMVETPAGVGPGTENRTQATTENGTRGQFTDHGDGSYSYRFATDIAAVPGVPYQPASTHRLGFEIRGYAPVDNPVYDFRPADGARTGLAGREMVSDESCNTCHERQTIHGGARFQHQYCVICHNPGSADANSGNTVDETVMIHKIHRGAALPSVQAGGEYAIWGFRNIKHDYSGVIYPQDIRNCRGCHDETDASTPQAANWYSVPTVEACGSCHDNVNFATGENHANGVTASNAECTICHADGELRADQAHRQLELAAAGAFRFNILEVTDTAPGQLPAIRFSVTNPQAGNAPYNIKTGAPFLGSSSAVSINLAWPALEINNLGNGGSPSGAPAQPVRINALVAGFANGDGSYTARASVPIPAGIAGSGIASLEGRTALDVNGDSIAERIPVTGVSTFFAITDPAPVSRRPVAALNGCNACHQVLSLHGNNRTDDLVNCAACHNVNATDIQRRVQAGVNEGNAPDGLREASVQLAFMTHALHAGAARESAYVAYNRSGTAVSYGSVVYPGRLANCSSCHVPGSYYPVGSFASGVTTHTGTDRQSPYDDTRITPNAAACFGCHASTVAVAHMEQFGGAFDARQTAEGTLISLSRGTVIETCAICHGAGRQSDVAVIHGLP